MTLRPKFSIITVTYNAASVIVPTLESVRAQTYSNYEYILVDGGSKDDTVAIAKASGIEFAHIISERDKGIYDAMNKGIALATGDYLCFLNAGDAFYAPDTLQTIADAIADEKELPDVLYGETAEVDENRNFDEKRQRALIRYYLDSGVGGLAVGVHTTQFEIRKPEHNLLERVLRVAKEEAARFEEKTGEVIVMVAGVCGPIEQAVREAEQYAAEDKARREAVDTRNNADQMVYQSEKTIEEMGDKIDEADKTDLQAKIDALKEALKGEDIEAIKAKQEELTKAFYAVSEKLYAQQGGQPGGPDMGGGNCGGDCGSCNSDPNVVDADYEVVD